MGQRTANALGQSGLDFIQYAAGVQATGKFIVLHARFAWAFDQVADLKIQYSFGIYFPVTHNMLIFRFN